MFSISLNFTRITALISRNISEQKLLLLSLNKMFTLGRMTPLKNASFFKKVP